MTPTHETDVLALERPARIAVIYCSATGNVHGMARAVADGSSRAGAEVRLRHLNNTLYHRGAIVPLGYTVHEVFNGGGNP